MKLVLGIDPGATGAAVAIDLESSQLYSYVLPGGKTIPAYEMNNWVLYVAADVHPHDIQVGIELTPTGWQGGQGGNMASIAKLAKSAGVWEGIVAAQGLAYRNVSPVSWKTEFGLKGKAKDDSRFVAQRELPWAAEQFAFKKDVGVADAALIALFVARRMALQPAP